MNNEQKINLIAILEDVQDQLLTELKPEFKQGMKQLCNRASIHTNNLIKYFDRVHSDENKELFGLAADDLRNKIELWIKEGEKMK